MQSSLLGKLKMYVFYTRKYSLFVCMVAVYTCISMSVCMHISVCMYVVFVRHTYYSILCILMYIHDCGVYCISDFKHIHHMCSCVSVYSGN